MSSQARGIALPFALQVGASNCCNIGDIVVHIRTGVPRMDDGVPYSGKLSRTINFAAFKDFTTASKINSSK